MRFKTQKKPPSTTLGTKATSAVPPTLTQGSLISTEIYDLDTRPL